MSVFDKSENQKTFADVLDRFSEANRANFGNHAYEAGFLQSLSVRMLDFMPKKYQQIFIEEMIHMTQKAERRAVKLLQEQVK